MMSSGFARGVRGVHREDLGAGWRRRLEALRVRTRPLRTRLLLVMVGLLAVVCAGMGLLAGGAAYMVHHARVGHRCWTRMIRNALSRR